MVRKKARFIEFLAYHYLAKNNSIKTIGAFNKVVEQARTVFGENISETEVQDMIDLAFHEFLSASKVFDMMGDGNMEMTYLMIDDMYKDW